MDRWRDRAFGISLVLALVALIGLPVIGIPLSVVALVAVALLGGGGALTLRASLDKLDAAKRRQRMRSIAIAGVLFALVAAFYAATIVRLGPNALRREHPAAGAPAGGTDAQPMTESCKRAGTCR